MGTKGKLTAATDNLSKKEHIPNTQLNSGIF